MGIICQPILKTIENQDIPVPSERMGHLFCEFLGRYNEWKAAKVQEMIWIFILLFLGICIILLPWFLLGRGLVMSVVMLVIFYFASRHYLELNEQVSHLFVNVHILHHHLTGKLEVGFCEHLEPCQCAENFRRYVIMNYNISFYNPSLR
ncbi:hypothetical protein E4K67_16535 [Desulfosporosinus fructosivorans]|uniref:Uncharacterized protein n=1 Tax=Desulfosporosinus fructosivorans TaxID=2018669 RepID=A0A4Z0R2Y8_9FIRM|nr:hypothetical protein [Desulfosporosinus fructosivorans]TGE36725.1 hypothetical protein E4K67_16535 [Desulfosporosinus fructosivorans]